MLFRLLLVLIGLSQMVACAVPARLDPDLPSSFKASESMVVTAHPLATQAGVGILEQGGTAVDAMIAVQAVLGLVEPQSSGLGGGAFVVYFDAETQQTTTFDGREKAPAAATQARFLREGQPLEFVQAWQSGLSVGVPGVPRLLETLHRRYGRLPWPKAALN